MEGIDVSGWMGYRIVVEEVELIEFFVTTSEIVT
jgi:hypothetical protein